MKDFFWCVVAAVSFLSGVFVTSNYYDLQIADKEMAVLQRQTAERKEFNEKLSKTTEELQHALARAAELASTRGADLERLRNANTRLQARIKAYSANPDAAALSRCSELLTEGAGLAAEGEGLLRKHSAEHDALIHLQKTKSAVK